MTNQEKAIQEQHTPWSEEIHDDIDELHELANKLRNEYDLFDGAPDAVFMQIDIITNRIKQQIRSEKEWLKE